VMGNISLVLSDRKIDVEAEHCLRDSERAALRARDLTQQLLTFSKGGAPVRSAVLLSDVVRESAGFALHGSNVRCDFDFGPNVWPADADKGQVAQVVHNVVINAVQAMPTGGVVSITLRNAEVAQGEIATLAAGRYLKLTIADEGAGISPDHLSRIFDPYFTTKQRGSGLGLATVYSIIKKHAGHLEVASKLGVGTTFSIWLPAADGFVEELATKESALLKRSGRALVMDDEPSIRAFMTNLLQRIGLEVTAVEDGAAAVKEYFSAKETDAPFVLVVLDLTVPAGMGGAEAMEKIRTLDPEVCAVVSSGYSKDPVVADYRAHGFRGIMPKPYNFDDVMRVVGGILPA
jgi:two-component system, cell cycle sensor histidine kinase and response regulator CckA